MKSKLEELCAYGDFDIQVTGYVSLNHLDDTNRFEDSLKSYNDKNLRRFQQYLNIKATENREKMRSEIVRPVTWFRKACRNNEADEFAVNAALFPLIDAVNVQTSIETFSCKSASITFVVNDYINQLQ